MARADRLDRLSRSIEPGHLAGRRLSRPAHVEEAPVVGGADRGRSGGDEIGLARDAPPPEIERCRPETRARAALQVEKLAVPRDAGRGVAVREVRVDQDLLRSVEDQKARPQRPGAVARLLPMRDVEEVSV